MKKIFLTEMAYSRETFKDNLEHHLRGALGEFYKARLGEKNNLLTWVDHWMKEVKTILNTGFVYAYQHKTKFPNKKKAFDEVKKFLTSIDEQYRHYAERVVMSDFDLIKKLKQKITDEDTLEFWSLVDGAIVRADELDNINEIYEQMLD